MHRHVRMHEDWILTKGHYGKGFRKTWMALVISLVLFLGHTEWWKSSLFPDVDWGEWSQGFHGDACNPISLWGFGDCSPLSSKEELEKRGPNRGKGRRSQLGLWHTNVRWYTHVKYRRREKCKKKKRFNGAVKSYMTARDHYKFNQKSYAVHPNSIQNTFWGNSLFFFLPPSSSVWNWCSPAQNRNWSQFQIGPAASLGPQVPMNPFSNLYSSHRPSKLSITSDKLFKVLLCGRGASLYSVCTPVSYFFYLNSALISDIV